jgi:hypothetical protein
VSTQDSAELSREGETRLGHYSTLIEGWATDCIAERPRITS